MPVLTLPRKRLGGKRVFFCFLIALWSVNPGRERFGIGVFSVDRTCMSSSLLLPRKGLLGDSFNQK